MNDSVNKEEHKDAYFQEKAPKRIGLWQPLAVGVFAALAGPLPLLLLPAPGLVGYLGAAAGLGMMLAAAGVAIALAYLFAGTMGLWALLAVLPAGFLLAFLLRRRAAYFDCALYACACVAGGLYGLYGLRDILAGQAGFYSLQESWQQIADGLAAGLEGGPGMGELMGLDPKLFSDSLALVGDMIPVVMPAVICLMATAAGFVSLLLARALAKRAGAPVKPMRPFRLWAVPRPAAYGAFLMGLGLLLCTYVLKLKDIEAIALAASVVIFAPFTIQGMSFFVFLIAAQKQFGRTSRNGLMIGLLALLLLLFPMGAISILLTTCSTLGLIEHFWRLRERFPANPAK